jgi:hypothetical protein
MAAAEDDTLGLIDAAAEVGEIAGVPLGLMLGSNEAEGEGDNIDGVIDGVPVGVMLDSNEAEGEGDTIVGEIEGSVVIGGGEAADDTLRLIDGDGSAAAMEDDTLRLIDEDGFTMNLSLCQTMRQFAMRKCAGQNWRAKSSSSALNSTRYTRCSRIIVGSQALFLALLALGSHLSVCIWLGALPKRAKRSFTHTKMARSNPSPFIKG